MEKNSKAIEKKLTNVKYNCSPVSHLDVNQEVCQKCKEKTCVYICPANVYNIDNLTGQTIIQYENCLECGACKIACPKQNINWCYPSSGCGVVFKNS